MTYREEDIEDVFNDVSPTSGIYIKSLTPWSPVQTLRQVYKQADKVRSAIRPKLT